MTPGSPGMPHNHSGSDFGVVKSKSPEGKEVFLCTEQAELLRLHFWSLRDAGDASSVLDKLQLLKVCFFFFGMTGPKLTQNFQSGLSSAQDKGWSLLCSCGHSGADPWPFCPLGLTCSTPGSFSSFPAVTGRINFRKSLLNKLFCHVGGAEKAHLCIYSFTEEGLNTDKSFIRLRFWQKFKFKGITSSLKFQWSQIRSVCRNEFFISYSRDNRQKILIRITQFKTKELPVDYRRM